jgi:putative ABC transport system permease protein
MFTNYFRTAFRSITRHKLYSGLNILGLAVGMAVALTIGLWAYYQYSFDRFIPGYGAIYQVRYKVSVGGDIQTINATALPLAAALEHDIPGIRVAVHTDFIASHGLVAGGNQLYLPGIEAGADFLGLFKYSLVQGGAAAALSDPYSIVLTRSTARSLFGTADPMGKLVRIDNEHDLKVSAVIADLPANATLQFGYIIPLSYKVNEQSGQWGHNVFQTFVALQPGTDYRQIAPQLRTILKKYSPDEYSAVKAEVFLQPMADWHLYTEFKNGVASGGMIDYVRLFVIIGVLVFAIACVNFMNLCIAHAERRVREVGIRKTIGSSRMHLIVQFLTESTLLVFIAFILALALVQLNLPWFSDLTGCVLTLPYSNVGFWLVMAGAVLFTGVVAGAHPAFVLSGFRPIKMLKGKITNWRGHSWPSRMLVIAQFTCAIALISSTMVVYEQVRHARERSTGYDVDRLMITAMSGTLAGNYPALKNELLASGLVTAVSRADGGTTTINSWWGVDDWPGKAPDDNLAMATIFVDESYFRTVGMRVFAGRGFSAADSVDGVVINEAAVRRLHLTTPINQRITMNGRQWKLRVVGVVKDALMLSPFSPAEPTFFMERPKWTNTVLYRLAPTADIQEALSRLKTIFDRYNPGYPYTWHFADDSYAAQFSLEMLIGRLAGIFAALAIFIACLGLFGLATHLADDRRKEIGIRKVLGASVPQIWALLSRDFVWMTALSALIASPLAYYFLNRWLQQYTYRITISPLVFLLAGAAAVAVTLLTVSFRSIAAARANPVKSIRTE